MIQQQHPIEARPADVRQVLMAVQLRGDRGNLELVEFTDRTVGVLRDGKPIAKRWEGRDVEKSVTVFMRARRLLDEGKEVGQLIEV